MLIFFAITPLYAKRISVKKSISLPISGHFTQKGSKVFSIYYFYLIYKKEER
jgi:hypothetical protein